MDTTAINKSLDATDAALNDVIDVAVKARNVKGLRALTQAAGNIESARKHVAVALAQNTPKE